MSGRLNLKGIDFGLREHPATPSPPGTYKLISTILALHSFDYGTLLIDWREDVSMPDDDLPVRCRVSQGGVHPRDHLCVVVAHDQLVERLRVNDDPVDAEVAHVVHPVVPEVRQDPARLQLAELYLIPLLEQRGEIINNFSLGFNEKSKKEVRNKEGYSLMNSTWFHFSNNAGKIITQKWNLKRQWQETRKTPKPNSLALLLSACKTPWIKFISFSNSTWVHSWNVGKINMILTLHSQKQTTQNTQTTHKYKAHNKSARN